MARSKRVASAGQIYHIVNRGTAVYREQPGARCLVWRAQQWKWSSLIDRERRGGLISPLPFDLPDSWDQLVNVTQPQWILNRIREELKSTRRRREQGNT